MGPKNVMLITGEHMASVNNEAFKIQLAFRGKGHRCDLYYFNRDSARRTELPRYDLAIWWTPLLPMFLSRQREWLNLQKESLALGYYVIEGRIHGLWRGDSRLKWQYIIVPSQFSKGCIEEMGFQVKEVIPHQIEPSPLIDHSYGKAWRARFPCSKKVLLYNGSQIYRKGLPRLREAINMISAKRSDFLMVFHTDDVKQPFHTPSRDLEGPNTIVEREFPHLPLPQAYGKMFYSDVIIHPATVEGFGLPILEALNMGKTLVCINAYGVNEIATPENSFMVTKVNPIVLSWKGYIDFKAMDYKAEDLATQIELALDASNGLLQEKQAIGLETAKRYHHSYDRFTEFL